MAVSLLYSLQSGRRKVPEKDAAFRDIEGLNVGGVTLDSIDMEKTHCLFSI